MGDYEWDCPRCGTHLELRKRVTVTQRRCPECGFRVTPEEIDRQLHERVEQFMAERAIEEAERARAEAAERAPAEAARARDEAAWAQVQAAWARAEAGGSDVFASGLSAETKGCLMLIVVVVLLYLALGVIGS